MHTHNNNTRTTYVQCVRERVHRKQKDMYNRHVALGVVTNAMIVRCLIARGMSVKLAAKLVIQALTWWPKRNPNYILTDPNDARAKQIAIECTTGKARGVFARFAIGAA